MALGGGRKQVRHVGFLRHAAYRWLIVGVLLDGAAVWGYRRFEPAMPTGGSAYGYLLGTIAALMILWLAFLGIRKRVISPGNWTLKGWVSAHVYLGISLVVIATLHSAFQFGWNLHTLFFALMLLVVVSGFIGVVLYVVVPRRLSVGRAETTGRQMLGQIEALDLQLHEAALPLSSDQAQAVKRAIDRSPVAGGVIRRLFGLYGGCGTAAALRQFRRSSAPQAVIALLEKKREALARARRHARTKALLEVWLYIHVPATFATLAAMVAHIVAVFFYS